MLSVKSGRAAGGARIANAAVHLVLRSAPGAVGRAALSTEGARRVGRIASGRGKIQGRVDESVTPLLIARRNLAQPGFPPVAASSRLASGTSAMTATPWMRAFVGARLDTGRKICFLRFQRADVAGKRCRRRYFRASNVFRNQRKVVS